MSGEGMTGHRCSGGEVGWELKEASVVPQTTIKAFVPGPLLSNKLKYFLSFFIKYFWLALV